MYKRWESVNLDIVSLFFPFRVTSIHLLHLTLSEVTPNFIILLLSSKSSLFLSLEQLRNHVKLSFLIYRHGLTILRFLLLQSFKELRMLFRISYLVQFLIFWKVDDLSIISSMITSTQARTTPSREFFIQAYTLSPAPLSA